MKIRHSFMMMAVEDLEGLSSFYQKVFGMRELERLSIDAEEGGVDEVELCLGDKPNFVFTLFRTRTREGDVPKRELVNGFVTDDLEALVARAVDHGATVVKAPSSVDGYENRVALMEDPEGHIVEAIEVQDWKD